MARGIIVFGASGSGTTTLGGELARALGFRHFDLDDYFWRWDTDVPFSAKRSREERVAVLLRELESCTHFVFSGSMCGWDSAFIPLFDLGVFVTAPAETRIERLKKREFNRFGERILQGGDMHTEHQKFLDWAAGYDTMEPPQRCIKLHKQWGKSLVCPVINIDGTAPVNESIEQVLEVYKPILPIGLAELLDGYAFEKNRVGCSSAAIYRCQGQTEALYLKIDKTSGSLEREYKLLVWLKDKIPVPQVRYWHTKDGLDYLLMNEIKGRMSCDCLEDTVSEPVENTIKLLADGILQLQSIDTNGCPYDNSINNKLKHAFYNIENNLVDMEDFNENNAPKTPIEVYNYLAENKPDEELCFCHGDYCLPNIFIDGDKLTGFIDINNGGIADKWQDIALCTRSLRYNLGDISKAQEDKYVDLLFEHLGITPDWKKINYYTLLDELF